MMNVPKRMPCKWQLVNKFILSFAQREVAFDFIQPLRDQRVFEVNLHEHTPLLASCCGPWTNFT